MQINTTGTLSGQLTYNILSDSGEEISVFTEFDGAGNFGGINIPTCGCTLENACNYNNEANINDGSCLFNDECGICDGQGAVFECGCYDIPNGDCDCDGNQLDALGVCGGACIADIDSDGICDDIDVHVGGYDECGICNGPGAIYLWMFKYAEEMRL